MREQGDTGAEPFWEGLVTADGVFAVDLQQRVVFWGPTVEGLIGRQTDQVLGKPCYEVVAGRDTRNHRFCRRNCPVIVNARRGRPTPDYDIVCPTVYGTEKWLNISIVILKRPGRANLVVHLCRDVTEHRRLEEFARQAAALLRELGQDSAPTRELQGPAGPPPRLSSRETEILRLLACGLTTREMAEALSISPTTVRNYVNRILGKLGVNTRLQAVVYASQLRLI